MSVSSDTRNFHSKSCLMRRKNFNPLRQHGGTRVAYHRGNPADLSRGSRRRRRKGGVMPQNAMPTSPPLYALCVSEIPRAVGAANFTPPTSILPSPFPKNSKNDIFFVHFGFRRIIGVEREHMKPTATARFPLPPPRGASRGEGRERRALMRNS